MKKEELAVIIEAHGKWFLGEGGAFRANLSGANLSDANLRDANLSDAKLIGANLIGANLSGANLRDANLSGADLSDANLSGADLSGADLRGANLSDAKLRDANLRDANLSDANLSDADLSGANLWSCAGERNYIKSIFVSEVYAITYTSEVLQIGCQSHEISEWWGFDDRTIAGMNGKNALSFWREWKDTIRMIIEKSPAAGGGK